MICDVFHVFSSDAVGQNFAFGQTETLSRTEIQMLK